MINVQNLSPLLLDEFSDFRQKRQDYLAAILQRGIDEGVIRQLPVAEVADFGIRLLDSVLSSMYEFKTDSQLKDLENLQKIAEDMLVRGILNL
ncbi:MAG: hypothetical protein ACOH5I_13325 [Oligoflexus sp.]